MSANRRVLHIMSEGSVEQHLRTKSFVNSAADSYPAIGRNEEVALKMGRSIAVKQANRITKVAWAHICGYRCKSVLSANG